MRKVYNRILQIAGNVIMLEADGVAAEELAEVISGHGTSLAQVIRLDGKKVFIHCVLDGRRDLQTQLERRRLR